MVRLATAFLLTCGLVTPARALDTIIASAPAELEVSYLGTYLDADLRPLPQRVSGGTIRPPVAANEIKVQYGLITTDLELRANAQAWQVNVAGGINMGQNYGFFRARRTEQIHVLEVPPGINHPPDARYYVSKIYVGRMYERHFSGEANAVNAEIQLMQQIPIATAGAGAELRSSAVQSSARILGFSPKEAGNGAFFVRDEKEVALKYAETGPAMPILFEVTELPSAPRVRRWAVELVALEVDRKNANGQDWDWDGNLNAPDPTVIFTEGLQFSAPAANDLPLTPAKTYAHRFNQRVPGVFDSESGGFTIEVRDRDWGSDYDVIGKLLVREPAQQGERVGDVHTFRVGLCTVSLRFTPTN